jgi:hypothetical protein
MRIWDMGRKCRNFAIPLTMRMNFVRLGAPSPANPLA